MNPSPRTSTRIALSLIALLLAAGAVVAVLLLGNGTGAGDAGTREPRTAQGAGDGELLEAGHRWTVTVVQDASEVVPDRDEGAGDIRLQYRFEVEDARADGSFVVRATLDDSGGPFAAGYRLVYVPRGDTLVLRSVALGDDQPLPAAHARLVLGQDFPLTRTIARRPSSHKATEAELATSNLPPALPDEVRTATSAGDRPDLG